MRLVGTWICEREEGGRMDSMRRLGSEDEPISAVRWLQQNLNDAPKLPSSFFAPCTTFRRKKVATSNAPSICWSTDSLVRSSLGFSSNADRCADESKGDREVEAEGTKRLKRMRVCWYAAGTARAGQRDRALQKVLAE